MLKRVLSFIIIVTLLSGAVGASAADGYRAEGNMPLCCKKAQSNGNAPHVSMARLCCKLNCSEPGNGGLSNASNLTRNQGATSATAIIPAPTQFAKFANRSLHARITHSHAANPKYIQHLALLI